MASSDNTHDVDSHGSKDAKREADMLSEALTTLEQIRFQQLQDGSIRELLRLTVSAMLTVRKYVSPFSLKRESGMTKV